MSENSPVVALTGASGFLGRHVLAEMVRRGHRPVCMTRATTDPLPLAVPTSIVDLDRPPNDLFAQLGRPNVVVHLAWDGLPNYGATRHLEVVYPSQVRFLRALLQQGVRRLVIAGTCFEYGLTEGRLHEDLSPSPVTAYAEAKVRLHASLAEHAAFEGVELVWARLFYVYGPGQPLSTLWGQVQQALAERWSSFPMSPGDQTRDYLPVEEAARLLSELALGALPLRAPLTVNVCSGQPIALRDLVVSWVAAAGTELPLQCGAYPYAAHEPLHAWGDRARLNDLVRGHITHACS